MNVIGMLHANFVFGRRIRVLTQEMAKHLPPESRTVLDIGCGDGSLAVALKAERPELEVVGVDVLVRPNPGIPVLPFDGTTLPFGDKSFDVAMFSDVLHHTDDPLILLAEAKRVARHAIVLKDHIRSGYGSYMTLRSMDWVGNAHHNVRLRYNYWTHDRWMRAFAGLGLAVKEWNGHLGLYPWPMSCVFDRNLHFVAQLRV